MGFDRIAILGVGLMGGSVALACRSAAPQRRVVGCGHHADDLKIAIDRGAIHEGSTDPIQAVAGADLVILCTPVGAFSGLMKSIAGALKPGAVLTDVGSTKRSIVRSAQQLLPPTAAFVGSHPMVGGEKQGILNARADLLSGHLCIITPTEFTDQLAVQRIEEFWQSLSMRTLRMSPETHDQLTADISHLPHAVAAALVRIQSEQSLRVAARGFADTTRIAAGDPALWRDIFLDNRDNLTAAVMRLQADLQQLLDRLNAEDASAVQQWLGAAAAKK